MPPPWTAGEATLRIAAVDYMDVADTDIPHRNSTGAFEPVNASGVPIGSDAAIGAWCELTPTGIVLTYGVKFTEFSVAQVSPDVGTTGFNDADGDPVTGYSINGEPFPLRNTFPSPTEWPAGTSIDLWCGRAPTDGPGPVKAIARFTIDDEYDPGPPEPPDSGSAEDGIYVGTIVLADPISGLYHYTDGDLPADTGPDSWANAYENTLWLGERDGLAPSTGGFTRRRVDETGGGGTYTYLCTPLFAIDNTTTRVSIFLYDGVGDFYDVALTRYVGSGETIFGSIYIPAGFAAAFVVGDDAAPSGQAVLAGSFWNFPA